MPTTSEILTFRPADFTELLKRLDNIERLIEKDNVPQIDDILTVEETCKYLKIAQPTLYRYIRTLNLPTFKVGNQRRFRRSELNEWTGLIKT
jgi:excisionase family DNA binding protein